jgi:hypothetical protein
MIEAADLKETTCSPDLPPKITATVFWIIYYQLPKCC